MIGGACDDTLWEAGLGGKEDLFGVGLPRMQGNTLIEAGPSKFRKKDRLGIGFHRHERRIVFGSDRQQAREVDLVGAGLRWMQRGMVNYIGGQ